MKKKYQEVCSKHGVSSKIIDDKDILKKINPSPIPSYMRRQRKGFYSARATTK